MSVFLIYVKESNKESHLAVWVWIQISKCLKKTKHAKVSTKYAACNSILPSLNKKKLTCKEVQINRLLSLQLLKKQVTLPLAKPCVPFAFSVSMTHFLTDLQPLFAIKNNPHLPEEHLP